MDLVSVVIPTLNRQQSLQRAVQSVRQQALPDDVGVEIIVIDNSADRSARNVLDTLEAAGGWPLRHFSEPCPGVANARNRGVAAATGRWVAFLDDDEEAAEGWLASLVRVARQTGADAVFGPVSAKADGAADIGPLAPYFSRSIDRPDGADITDLSAYLGTNNSMFDRMRCLDGAQTFETSLNESGGEDSLLLKQLIMRDRRLAWAADACVTEWAALRRLNWGYIRKRKFLSGQIRVFVQHMLGARWHHIAFWMAVGLVQFIGAGAAALCLRFLAPTRADRAAATAFGGLGKLFWTARFRPSLYGSGLVS